MSARTGLGPLAVAVLAATAEVGGTSGARHRRTTRVLEVLEREQGLGPRYAYPLVQDLGAPWRLHLPLLDRRGNWGSQQGDPAADARYTEVRLSRVGALALAAERGEVGPVPLGLVEGSLYRDGPVPPFAPARVLEALATGGADAGPPAMPTGGTVEGNIAGLLAGRRARLTLGCTVIAEPGQLVITEVPLGVPVDDLVHHLFHASQVGSASHVGSQRRYLDYAPVDGAPVPVLQVRDESSGRHGVRVVCAVAPGADLDAARGWIRSVWPVTVQVDCRLPAPMRRLLAAWDRGDGSGLAALAAIL